jgi:4-cresol dehydrogenase (hydroxylating) cytochrome subunit
MKTRIVKHLSELLVIIAIAAVMKIGSREALAQATDPSGSELKDAPTAYQDRCFFCHETKVGPVLRGRGLHTNYVNHVVRNGSRAMPAFRVSEVDDQMLAQLTAFLSKTQPKLVNIPGAIVLAGNADKGKAVYFQSCVTCHGAKGKGDGIAAKALVPPPMDFSSADSRKKAPAELLKTIEEGKPGSAMPSWETALPADDIQNVLAYLLTLR